MSSHADLICLNPWGYQIILNCRGARTARGRRPTATRQMRGEAFPDVASAIVALIEQGAPLFNEGRARECAELYRRGAMAILAMPPGGSGGPSPGDRQTLEAATISASEHNSA